MENNIIVTAANSAYYNTLLTLIASIHRESHDLVDQIFVFNLGLCDSEIQKLVGLSKVSIVEFPEDVDVEPSQHVYKCYCVHWAANHGQNVFWLDAGVMLLQPIDGIFKTIKEEGIFLVGDHHHLNKNFTHDKCREIMNATESELNDTQLSSGILGYKSEGPYQELINDAYHFSKIAGCVKGDEQNHRHDQSVYSILASRYGCKRQDLDIYGYWTDLNRNLKTAGDVNAVIFAHRNDHFDYNGLIHNES